MNDKKIQTLDDIHVFLEGASEIEFSIENKEERYLWIQKHTSGSDHAKPLITMNLAH